MLIGYALLCKLFSMQKIFTSSSELLRVNERELLLIVFNCFNGTLCIDYYGAD